jgi:hypothetical protein
VYDKIKYLGDIKHKIPTQCCIENKLFDFKKGGEVNKAVSGGQVLVVQKCHFLRISFFVFFMLLNAGAIFHITLYGTGYLFSLRIRIRDPWPS